MIEMTDFTIDSNVPMTGRTIASAVAKIPPAIIVAAVALGAYQAAPILVEYFRLNSYLHAARPDPGVFLPPTQNPITAPLPSPLDRALPMARPATPPPLSLNEAPAAPIIAVEPGVAVAPVTRGAMIRPPMRGQFFRARPPHLRFVRGFSGFGGFRLGHVVQMLHFARRFGRF
jgi:hypothetical protein